MTSTHDEMEAQQVFEHEIERWREKLFLDPIWKFKLEVLEDDELGHAAAVDLSRSEYYSARIIVSKSQLALKGKALQETASHVVCHELLHVLTIDYQHAALAPMTNNAPMRKELRYRYEQLMSRLTEVLLNLDSVGEDNEPTSGEDTGTPDEMLRVPEVPTGGEDG